MIIFILGLPSSGKTTLGSKLKNLIENLSIYEYDNLEGCEDEKLGYLTRNVLDDLNNNIIPVVISTVGNLDTKILYSIFQEDMAILIKLTNDNDTKINTRICEIYPDDPKSMFDLYMHLYGDIEADIIFNPFDDIDILLEKIDANKNMS